MNKLIRSKHLYAVLLLLLGMALMQGCLYIAPGDTPVPPIEDENPSDEDGDNNGDNGNEVPAVLILEDFTEVTIANKHAHAKLFWKGLQMPNRQLYHDTDVYHSEPASLRVENIGGGRWDNARFEIALPEPVDLTMYKKITFWFRPSIELQASALKIRLYSADGPVGTHTNPVSPPVLPANTWSKVEYDISHVEERDAITVIDIFLRRDDTEESAPENYDFNIDTLALEP